MREVGVREVGVREVGVREVGVREVGAPPPQVRAVAAGLAAGFRLAAVSAAVVSPTLAETRAAAALPALHLSAVLPE